MSLDETYYTYFLRFFCWVTKKNYWSSIVTTVFPSFVNTLIYMGMQKKHPIKLWPSYTTLCRCSLPWQFLLQNHANKSRSNKEQEHRFLRGKPKREKPRNARRRITIIGGVLQYTRGQTLYVLSIWRTLSHLFYDYLGLYIGANNSLSWWTRNIVVMCYV